MSNLVVFASRRGSNFQAIVDACKSGLIDAKVTALFCDNPDADVLSKAKKANIPVIIVDPTDGDEIVDKLMRHSPDLIVLAGYLKKIPPLVIDTYDNIVNIHPSLLPKYGGKGMYGLAVHRAVIANGEIETGVTIHRVTLGYDEGEIIEQLKIRVHEHDTPESLASRILKYEQILLVHTIKRLIDNAIQ